MAQPTTFTNPSGTLHAKVTGLFYRCKHAYSSLILLFTCTRSSSFIPFVQRTSIVFFNKRQVAAELERRVMVMRFSRDYNSVSRPFTYVPTCPRSRVGVTRYYVIVWACARRGNNSALGSNSELRNIACNELREYNTIFLICHKTY